MPEERDDPRRHGDKLEEVIQPRKRRGDPAPTSTSADRQKATPDRQKPTPGSAEGERDVEEQDK